MFSDTHGGHKLGLLHPDTIIMEEGPDGEADEFTPALTATQRWLWECYQQDIESVRELAGNDAIVVVHNGDLTWGLKFPEGVVSFTPFGQTSIALWNMRPWLDLPNLRAMRFIHGTASHEFGQGSTSLAVAHELELLASASGLETNIGARRHSLLSIDWVSFDCAHHGPSAGMRQWTTGNQLRYYLKSLMNDEIVRHREPPRVTVRSHYHTYCRETVRIGTEYESDIVVTPAYCGMSHYAVQATRSAYLQGCGMVAFEIVDGRLRDIRPFVRTLDLRTEEAI